MNLRIWNFSTGWISPPESCIGRPSVSCASTNIEEDGYSRYQYFSTNNKNPIDDHFSTVRWRCPRVRTETCVTIRSSSLQSFWCFSQRSPLSFASNSRKITGYLLIGNIFLKNCSWKFSFGKLHIFLHGNHGDWFEISFFFYSFRML